MAEATMTHPGKAALARVLEQLSSATERIDKGEDSIEVADSIWTDFTHAVGYAMSELRGAEAEGVARWRSGRHETPGT